MRQVWIDDGSDFGYSPIDWEAREMAWDAQAMAANPGRWFGRTKQTCLTETQARTAAINAGLSNLWHSVARGVSQGFAKGEL